MKIKNNYNKATDQKNEIIDQQTVNISNIDNANSANSINQYIKKLTKLNTDWEVLTHNISEQFFPSSIIFSQDLYFEWIIELDFLPEYLIPYINIQILYRSSENLAQKAFEDSSIFFKTAYIIQNEQDENNPSISKNTLIANIFIRESSATLSLEDIEAKLLITLQNPKNYV